MKVRLVLSSGRKPLPEFTVFPDVDEDGEVIDILEEQFIKERRGPIVTIIGFVTKKYGKENALNKLKRITFADVQIEIHQKVTAAFETWKRSKVNP